jgi:hypothetical protein
MTPSTWMSDAGIASGIRAERLLESGVRTVPTWDHERLRVQQARNQRRSRLRSRLAGKRRDGMTPSPWMSAAGITSSRRADSLDPAAVRSKANHRARRYCGTSTSGNDSETLIVLAVLANVSLMFFTTGHGWLAWSIGTLLFIAPFLCASAYVVLTLGDLFNPAWRSLRRMYF